VRKVLLAAATGFDRLAAAWEIVTTDAEIDEAIAQAALHPFPEAVGASYDAAGDAIAIRFVDGIELRASHDGS
jgi:hypothetical protein